METQEPYIPTSEDISEMAQAHEALSRDNRKRPVNLKHEAETFTELKRLLINYNEHIAHDLDCLHDTLEGCTNLHEAIESVLQSIAEDDVMIDGMNVRLGLLEQRKQRVIQRKDGKRQALLEAFQRADLPKITTCEGTVYRSKVAPKVIITDESLLPESAFKITKSVDKTAIKKDLNNGLSVPGAFMSNGGETINIKRT